MVLTGALARRILILRPRIRMSIYTCPNCGLASTNFSAYCPACRTRIAEALPSLPSGPPRIGIGPAPVANEFPPIHASAAEVPAPVSLPERDAIPSGGLARGILPSMSGSIAAACAILFVGVAVLDLTGIIPREQVFVWFGLSYEGVLGHGRVYQFLTAPLLHASFFSLVFNMLALITLGPALEQTLGRLRYLQLSALSGATSMIVFLFLTRETGQVDWGYSDILLGIFVAQAVYFPEQKVMVYGIFPLKTQYTVILMAAIVLYGSASERGGPAELAHFAGAAAVWLHLRRRR